MSACAFVYVGSTCGCSRAAHPPGSSHAFVPPEPQPGADEAEVIAREWCCACPWAHEGRPHHSECNEETAELAGNIRAAVAAGRARGIEEGKAVCPHVCGHCANRNNRIADAIAKETTS